MNREDVLNRASKIVMGDRADAYGPPEQSFGRIAEFWSTYLDADITPADVAAMMGLLKLARIAGGRDSHDSWVDLAGYAACGGELHVDEGSLPFDQRQPFIGDVWRVAYAPGGSHFE